MICETATPNDLDGIKLLDVLSEGDNSTTYRAIDLETSQLRVVKLHKTQYPTENQKNKFSKEFEIGRQLQNVPFVIKYFRFCKTNHGKSNAIIMEDFHGESLHSILQQITHFTLHEFLGLAIRMLEGLSHIHQHGVIHQSICPKHVLVSRQTGEIKYIDFGLSTLLNKKFQATVSFKDFEHALEWISPEQTGRMNKDVDYRTDLYSLGLVFYRMFCGIVPFSSPDPTKVVYAHIAKVPVPPCKINPQIPEAVSDIILRLLAKNAEDRYQSIHGIKMDLKQCLDQLQVNQNIQNFKLAQQDLRSTFQICQKMYGREKETKILLNSFDRVSSGQVSTQLLLVSGYSGIGKTRLINEVHKPLIRDKGYFISGKIDQFARGSPYSSIVQAFKQLVLMLLSESEERIGYWKARLSAALKQQGQVIVDVIPEVELIIGQQPKVAELAPSENQNRFKAIFAEFIRAFADSSHPLVIFLDDLQWADIPTLHLMESILTDPDTAHLLIIGAYRDNEVNESHPLCMMLSRITSKMDVINITLQPLGVDHVNQLIADTLGCTMERSHKLAQLVMEKTLGNPFFVQMFLINLAQAEAIRFNHVEGKWEWDVAKIASKNITENVVVMMMQRIQKLDTKTQQTLSLAAAIGNKFELKTLSIICKTSIQETAIALWPAIKEELVLVHGEETGFALANLEVPLEGIQCQFLHDQVQRAAYELVNEDMRKYTHLNIGRLLVQSMTPEQLEEKIFDVVFHFKVAASLLNDAVENLQLAKLFYRASQRAKDSSAYVPSYEYAAFGVHLLPSDAWESYYDITFSLYKQLAECEYLRDNYEAAEELYPRILQKCRTIYDKTEVYMVKIYQYEMQQRYVELVDTVRQCLLFYNVSIPDLRDERSILEAALQNTLKEIQKSLDGRDIMDALNNPPLTNSDEISILKLLVWLWAPVYCIGDKTYLALTSAIMASYTLKHGNSSLSAIAFTAHSFSHSFFSTNNQETYAFGKLGVDLLDVYSNEPIRHRCYFMFGIGASNLLKPLTDALYYLDKGAECALMYGDIPYAVYITHHQLAHRYLGGVSLRTVDPLMQQGLAFMKRKNTFIYNYGMGATLAAQFHLEYPPVDEEVFLETNKTNKINLGAYYVGKVQCLFWDHGRDYSAIFRYIELALINIDGVMGFYVEKEFFFVTTMLIYAALCDQYPVPYKFVELAKTYFAEFEVLTKHCPANNEHKLFLMKAEKARYENRDMDCISWYSKAQSSANASSFIQYEALANDMTGRFWHSKTMQQYARTHFKEAFYLYNNWGSKRKVSDLKKHFARYLTDFNIADYFGAKDEVDVQTVLRASEALSMEMSLEELLDTMMKIVLENSGAQRGAFMLAEGGEGALLLVAEGDMDTMQVATIRAVPLSGSSDFPHTIINYVVRTKETVIIDDASKNTQFVNDDYLLSKHIGSILCIPLIRNNVFKGVVYLENSVLSDVFNEQRIKIVGMIMTQILMHLENAKFAHLLESEKKYRALSAELVQAKKKLEEFIDTLCHELRNPLNGIYGNSEFLDDLLKTLSKSLGTSSSRRASVDTCLTDMKDMLNGIVISSNHLKDIVDTVLNVSRVEKQDRTLQTITFSPYEIINNVVAMFQAKAKEKSIYLRTQTVGDCGLVVGDTYRITQVLINLVSNAIKFTVHGGITISFKPEFFDDNVLLHFSVFDTGIGITPEEQQKLFRPFVQANSTTNAKYGGTGLGLSISKELVELMGGTISLDSIKDAGTTFTFFIPCKRALAQSTVTTKRKLSSESETTTTKNKMAKRCHVLVVDDNMINQNLLKRILEREGFSTTVVGNGKEAVDIITNPTNNQTYPVILMDLEMPIMNGIEATQKIRAFEKENNMASSFIIGVSANARDYHCQNALEIGMNSYITKPFQKKEILDQLESFLK